MEIALILIAIFACVILPAYLHFANKRKAESRLMKNNG